MACAPTFVIAIMIPIHPIVKIKQQASTKKTFQFLRKVLGHAEANSNREKFCFPKLETSVLEYSEH